MEQTELERSKEKEAEVSSNSRTKTVTNPVQILAQLNSLLMKIKTEKLVGQKLDQEGKQTGGEKWKRYDARFTGLIDELKCVYAQLKDQ